MFDNNDAIATALTELSAYNLSHLNTDELCALYNATLQAAQANTVVTALTACHAPTEAQLEAIDACINHYAVDSERLPIITKVLDIKVELIKNREAVFTLINEGTSRVFAVFKEGKSEIDRDKYIQLLSAFRVLKEKIEVKWRESKQDNDDERLCLSMVFNANSYVDGDLKNLNLLHEASKGFTVPDFTPYNQRGR